MMSSPARPLRILHVVGGMNRAGVETWLMHVLRATDRDRFHMDFLVHTDQPCAYDDEIRAWGAEVIPCLSTARPVTYARNLRRILHARGPYDIIHSHVHHFSGYILPLAAQAGVPVRIAHSHNDTLGVQGKSPLHRKLYFHAMRRAIERSASFGLAASRPAATSLFGSDWEDEDRVRILYCGLELAPFRQLVDRSAVRRELGLASSAFLVGHVGRFVEQKNHHFLVEVARDLMRREPLARFLLVGDGPLRPIIEQMVASTGLMDRFVFLGNRPDIPRLLSAMDVFILPSLHEGLPMVGIEAQAAGVPMVLSDAVTPEVTIVPALVTRMSLSQPPAAWSNAAHAAVLRAAASDPRLALTTVERSQFNIAHGVGALEALYAAASR